MRVPPQGVKAKWVRIELRKVETLPGGGPANTFYDFVGPSPVNLWTTPDEYTLLRSVSSVDAVASGVVLIMVFVSPARLPVLYSHTRIDSSQCNVGQQR